MTWAPEPGPGPTTLGPGPKWTRGPSGPMGPGPGPGRQKWEKSQKKGPGGAILKEEVPDPEIFLI